MSLWHRLKKVDRKELINLEKQADDDKKATDVNEQKGSLNLVERTHVYKQLAFPIVIRCDMSPLFQSEAQDIIMKAIEHKSMVDYGEAGKHCNKK